MQQIKQLQGTFASLSLSLWVFVFFNVRHFAAEKWCIHYIEHNIDCCTFENGKMQSNTSKSTLKVCRDCKCGAWMSGLSFNIANIKRNTELNSTCTFEAGKSGLISCQFEIKLCGFWMHFNKVKNSLVFGFNSHQSRQRKVQLHQFYAMIVKKKKIVANSKGFRWYGCSFSSIDRCSRWWALGFNAKAIRK